MELRAEQYQIILSKFLLNLPKEELDDPARLSHQAEKAFYYYLDVILKKKQASDWKKQRQQFFSQLREHAPPFLKINPSILSDKLLQNKPVCGAIVFNKDNSKVLVIKARGRWGFPKGKQNQGETLIDCAVREVEEETGINIASKIDQRVRIDFSNHEGKLFFYVARGVPEQERISIDKSEVDQVFWMSLEMLKVQISSRFAERSKIAWNLYQKDLAKRSNIEQYAPKYFIKDQQQVNFKEDPLRAFQLNQDKLWNILEVPKYLRGN